MNFPQNAFARTAEWLADWLHSVTTMDVDVRPEWVEVEFIGGPIDGYVEPVKTEMLWQLPPALEFYVTRQLFDSLHGREPRRLTKPTSIAMYDLVPIGTGWAYCFSHQSAVSS